MTEITLYSGAVTLFYLFVAVTIFWAMLRWLDRLAGIRFKDRVVPVILGSRIATALYFGARILAVAIVVSAVLS